MAEPEVAPPVEVPFAVKQTTKLVKVPLDPEEQRKLGQAIANLMVQSEHLKDELKKTIDTQRAQINALKGTIRDHARSLSNGWREELATVEVYYDFNTETVRTYLKGKCLEDRPMTPEEKQLDLEMCLQQGMELKVKKPAATGGVLTLPKGETLSASLKSVSK